MLARMRSNLSRVLLLKLEFAPGFAFGEHRTSEITQQNEIQIRRGHSRRRPQWAGGRDLSGARGIKRIAAGEERLHRRRHHLAEDLSRLRRLSLALLVSR